jgi:hypothetical protein
MTARFSTWVISEGTPMTMHHALAVVVRLHDEVVQHLLGVAEVGDDAVLHRLNGDDVARRAAEHLLGLLADGLDLVGLGVYRDDGGLVDDDALAVGKDERVGRPEIDGQVVGEETEQRAHIVNARVPHLITV